MFCVLNKVVSTFNFKLFFQVYDDQISGLYYEKVSCTPYADCQKVIEFDGNSGEIKMLKPNQDEFHFQLMFTVKVCLKVFLFRLSIFLLIDSYQKYLCFV